MASQLTGCTDLRYLWRKLKARFAAPQAILSDRAPAVLPDGHGAVTVEQALNSRCSSDFDGDPEVLHWGMADTGTTLTDAQVDAVVAAASCRRFSTALTGAAKDRGSVVFFNDAAVSGKERETLLIENGMLQQAVGLVCAAMGVAVVFRSDSIGRALPGNRTEVLRYRLEPMRPSYKGAYWTDRLPGPEKSWLTGNLPDPDRKGRMPLFMALAAAMAEKRGENALVTRAHLGQLLWAARGRTPHLYLSKPWGLTIPTAYGVQHRTGLAVLLPDGSGHVYGSLSAGRPTHRLSAIEGGASGLHARLTQHYPGPTGFILLQTATNDDWALMETGYMLQNILVQAAAINCAVEAAVEPFRMPPGSGSTTTKALIAMAMA